MDERKNIFCEGLIMKKKLTSERAEWIIHTNCEQTKRQKIDLWKLCTHRILFFLNFFHFSDEIKVYVYKISSTMYRYLITSIVLGFVFVYFGICKYNCISGWINKYECVYFLVIYWWLFILKVCCIIQYWQKLDERK